MLRSTDYITILRGWLGVENQLSIYLEFETLRKKSEVEMNDFGLEGRNRKTLIDWLTDCFKSSKP